MNLGTNQRVQSEVALSGTVFQKQLKRDNGMFIVDAARSSQIILLLIMEKLARTYCVNEY